MNIRQRFVTLELAFLPPELEARVVAHESGAAPALARSLVELGQRLRELRMGGLSEAPGTRLLIDAARLATCGIPTRAACYAALVAPRCDEAALAATLRELVDAAFP